MGEVNIDRMIKVYDKHKNLKLAAKELDVPWQTLYYKLRLADHPVMGG